MSATCDSLADSRTIQFLQSIGIDSIYVAADNHAQSEMAAAHSAITIAGDSEEQKQKLEKSAEKKTFPSKHHHYLRITENNIQRKYSYTNGLLQQ